MISGNVCYKVPGRVYLDKTKLANASQQNMKLMGVHAQYEKRIVTKNILLNDLAKTNHLPTRSRTPSIIAQCRSMPIKIMALIRNVSQCRSLPINADQF